MNELAVLCEKVGGDVENVRKGMATDVRIGRHFLYAGVGYGGSCFPKDVQALMATGRKEDVKLEIVNAAESANARQKHHLVKKVVEWAGSSNLKGKTFAVWGLAFKPNTDDIREAPALIIIEELLKMGASVKAFDPVAMEHTEKVFGSRVKFCETSYDAVQGADALLIVTEWNEFRQADYEQVKDALKTPMIFDGRNILDPTQIRRMGFTYYGVGRRA
jgi:UDPglucose 6-dehydrogenase